MRASPCLVVAAAFAAALLALVAAPRAARAGFDPDAIYKVPDDGAPTSGPADAPLTIVEFSDYACGYCIKARASLAALELLYPGQIRWVHHSVPFISGTPLGAEAARAAAEQGKHAAMEAQLYAMAGRYDRVAVEMLAQGIGLDMVRFRAALDAGTGRPGVAADVELARRLGVAVTPAFFLNGRAVLGNQPLSTFIAVVEQELARAAAVQRETSLTGAALYARLVADGRPAAEPGPRTPAASVELSTLSPYRIGLGLPGLARGPDNAPVTLVVFSDFECPFCARNEPALRHVRERFGPLVRVVFRNLPLPFHRRAVLAAEAALAAGAQGKFWEMHDRLFSGTAGSLVRADLEREAEALGLDLARFRAELDAHTYRDAVRLDAAGGNALGVDGTPSMFVNGVMVQGGAKAPAQLEQVVQRALEQAQKMMALGISADDVYAVSMTGAKGHERSDPSTVPLPRGAALLQPTAMERLQIATAACRRRGKPAIELAPLPEALAAIARRVCAPYGIAP